MQNEFLGLMYKITLLWQEENQWLYQTITSNEVTKNSRIIRIGREPSLCDIVIKDTTKTVSPLHAGICFDLTTNTFYLNNLTQNFSQPNPILVDGKKIIVQKAPLRIGSQIFLGKKLLKVKTIKVKKQLPPVTINPSIYGIKCQCGNILPYSYLELFCPFCGRTIQSGQIQILKSSSKLQ
ncbi:MAG: FHA domain-containing protein [Microcoleaceae cyanobacterium MO_207.B10]|nr:FHA domain-containing protein [Microcoleaceae cyanobacterium MO_207.B10]